jgi:hypothetical protein
LYLDLLFDFPAGIDPMALEGASISWVLPVIGGEDKSEARGWVNVMYRIKRNNG